MMRTCLLYTSAMARSVWKGPFVDLHLLKKAEAAQDGGSSAPIKTWSRRSTILPQFVGLTFNVYNGRKFVPVSVNEDTVSYTHLDVYKRQVPPVTAIARRRSSSAVARRTVPEPALSATR